MTEKLLDDVYWLNQCFELEEDHHHVAVYLLTNGDDSILIDTGSFYHLEEIRTQIDETTDGIEAAILSHADAPHSGNVREFKNTWDEMEVIAATGSPEVQGLPTDDFRRSVVGEDMIVCGRTFSFIDPPLADRNHTTWIYEHDSKILVTADGFGHYHFDGECDLVSSDFDGGIREESVHRFHKQALRWLHWVDPDKLESVLVNLFDEYDLSYIAPIHGNPISEDDLDEYMDRLVSSVKTISRSDSFGEA